MAQHAENPMATQGIIHLPNHRRELSRIEAHESSTDNDELSDDLKNLPPIDTRQMDPIEVDELVGFSISRAQTTMKSPETPAAEKARALTEFQDYFDSTMLQTIEDSTEHQNSDSNGDSTDELKSPENIKADAAVSKSHLLPNLSAFSLRPQRFSLSRPVSRDVGDGTRDRSSSAPSQVLLSIRKLLPDFWTPSAPESHPREDQDQGDIVKPRDESFNWSNQQPFSAKSSTEDNSTKQNTLKSNSESGLDGSTESRLQNNKQRPSANLHRNNTDHSLYLDRTATGLSSFDDTSAYANVTEMINSRFKAISDSFRDSSLRLPRFRNVRTQNKTPDYQERSLDNIAAPGAARDTTVNGTAQNWSNTNSTEDQSKSKSEVHGGNRHGSHPILDNALSRATGDLIVLGGYRGSVLRSAKPPHQQLWAPIKAGLNLRKVNLEVGLTREDEDNMEESVIPAGIISHIGPIDICRRLLRIMKKSQNARDNKLRVQDWGYDWRLSPEISSQRLIKFLESLECNHPETPPERRGATVIAHSLGGLITRHAVNQRPDLFAGVVFCGVPQNCVNILGPLRNGDEVLISSRVLTAQVNFTIRTSFALLPEDGRCFLQKHTNQRYDLDFFNPETWKEYRLSPCINPPLPPAAKASTHKKSIIGSISENVSSLHVIPTKKVSLPSIHDHSRSHELKSNADHDKSTNLKPSEAEVDGQNGNLHRGMVERRMEPSMEHSHNKPPVAVNSTLPHDEAQEYLARTLKEVLQFKKELHFQPSHQENNRYPPHAFIFGKTVPTVFGARVPDREGIKRSDAFDDLAFAAGDGVVLASAAQLPRGYRCVKNGRVGSDRGHIGLMGDLEGIGQCLSAVFDARAKGVGLGLERLRNQK